MLLVLVVVASIWALLLLAICAICAVGGAADEESEQWYRDHESAADELDHQKPWGCLTGSRRSAPPAVARGGAASALTYRGSAVSAASLRFTSTTCGWSSGSAFRQRSTKRW